MKYQTIAKAGPSPEKLKRRVSHSERPTYIKTSSRVYKIKWGELRNLALDNYEAVEAKAAELEQDDIGFMGRNCLLCNHNAQSVMRHFFEDGAEPELGSDACNYHGNLGVRIAHTWQERKTGIEFYAETNPCAIEEAMVDTLEKHGKLESYRTSEEYRFLPLTAFKKQEATPKDFPAPRVSLIAKLKDLLKV